MPKGVYLHKPENYPPSRKGTTLTDAHKQKLAEFLKGNKWNRGRKHTEQSSLLKRKNSARYWLGKKRGPQSVETIQKRSNSMKGHAVSEKVRERMRNLSKGKFGADHPKWTEDKKSPLHKAVRQLYKYVDWRTAVFTRDNFTCVLCGTTGYMEADHYPNGFAGIMKKNNITDISTALACEELWDTGNGRTLCKPCHYEHTFSKKPEL